jgi:hypothetical protein
MGFKDEVVLIGAPQPYGEVFVMRYDGGRAADNQWNSLPITSGKRADPAAWQPHGRRLS